MLLALHVMVMEEDPKSLDDRGQQAPHTLTERSHKGARKGSRRGT